MLPVLTAAPTLHPMMLQKMQQQNLKSPSSKFHPSSISGMSGKDCKGVSYTFKNVFVKSFFRLKYSGNHVSKQTTHRMNEVVATAPSRLHVDPEVHHTVNGHTTIQ